jgi:hypothetical protein
MEEYWATEDRRQRARILRKHKMEVIFFCENTACGERYSEYPTYIPPISNRGRIFFRHEVSRTGLEEYGDGFKPLDTLLGNLCRKCGIGRISVWFGLVDVPKRELAATAGDAICDCGSNLEYVDSALEHIKPRRSYSTRDWHPWGHRLVATRGLRLTPLAQENGQADIRFFESPNQGPPKGIHDAADPNLEELLESLRKRHLLYGEIASPYERFYYEKYQAKMDAFRADLFNPDLASTDRWRRTYLGIKAH